MEQCTQNNAVPYIWTISQENVVVLQIQGIYPNIACMHGLPKTCPQWVRFLFRAYIQKHSIGVSRSIEWIRLYQIHALYRDLMRGCAEDIRYIPSDFLKGL